MLLSIIFHVIAPGMELSKRNPLKSKAWSPKEKQAKIGENIEKHGETGEKVEKHGETGRIRGKHRKTWENRENQGKT